MLFRLHTNANKCPSGAVTGVRWIPEIARKFARGRVQSHGNGLFGTVPVPSRGWVIDAAIVAARILFASGVPGALPPPVTYPNIDLKALRRFGAGRHMLRDPS
jgi:hypothetical protein